MAVATDSLFLDVILVLAPILYLIYWCINNNNDYWDKKGVPNIKGGLMMGAMTGRESHAEGVFRLYKQFSEERIGGFFQFKTPVLMVNDLDLIHKIMVKDFSSFYDRPSPTTKNDPLATNLFNLRGQVWRELRYKLTPTFSTGKLKGMFDQVTTCGDNTVKDLERLSNESDEIKSKNLFFEFTLDVIASCAFGLQFKHDSIESKEFKANVKKLFKTSPIVLIKYSMMFFFPKLSEMLDIRQFPRESAVFFSGLTKSTIQYRKKHNLKRNDYFQLLIALKDQEESGNYSGLPAADTSEDDVIIDQLQYADKHKQTMTTTAALITDDVISANTFLFLTGGTESTATTVNFTLFELSRRDDIQQTLHQEVDTVLAKHGEWTYSAVKEMTYLDQIIQETLRLYPVFPHIFRECVEPYMIPDSEVVIDKGVLVCIPVCALQKDPKHYPEPDMFKPERFAGNNFKPNPAFLPFGDGPRICIAMRFAVMEVKTCIAKIMAQYTVKLGSKTQLPLVFDKKTFIPSVKGGIWLSFSKR